MDNKHSGGWLYQALFVAATILFITDHRVLEHGSIAWAFLAGFFLLLELNRRRRWRVKNPANPPTVTDKLARVMFNFYEPAAPFVALLAFVIICVGTALLLFTAREAIVWMLNFHTFAP